MSARVTHGFRSSVPTPKPFQGPAKGRFYSHKVVVQAPKPSTPKSEPHFYKPEFFNYKDDQIDSYLKHFVPDKEQATNMRKQFEKVAFEAHKLRNRLPKTPTSESP